MSAFINCGSSSLFPSASVILPSTCVTEPGKSMQDAGNSGAFGGTVDLAGSAKSVAAHLHDPV
eukprot:CAMPEP_0197689680 /NCGR_PEP_ID=MMETSP1338-20131121/107233_1 /TAXON_ID=43686 ORGANISM="Pelagodinium beii, Strain RCC1491" /NCGR_SAMPLE_ID=MMETSP1338 /ASSEMBLY_ACC=CAM_ASM_000754 /LENGTH=62 /DNA_ID=CAMNT_0043272049 /DNA_START=113 /DNA_END=302 /DNA_ORIENTATION=+